MNHRFIKIIALRLSLLLAGLSPALGQTTAISYQGRLLELGVPANGQYSFQFTVFDSAGGGNQISSTLAVTPVGVTNGLFAVSLDFGPSIFTGPSRWLQLAVATNSAGPFTSLAPRQSITATPYALQSLTASNVLGFIADAQLSANIARLNSNPTFIGKVNFSPALGAPFAVNNSSLITNLNADLLDGQSSSSFALTNHTHSAADITSGTLADARLSANVALLNKTQNFAGTNTFTNTTIVSGPLTATNVGSVLAGDGSRLLNLNAGSLTGIVPSSAIPVSVAQLAASQTFTGTPTFSPPTGPPLRVGNTNLVANLNADLLDGLSSTAFWNIGGNTSAGSGLFLGTLDNVPLEFQANHLPSLRIWPHSLAPNLVAGHPSNTVNTNTGGQAISGGINNTASNYYAVVAGGSGNLASGQGSVVGGGEGNSATGQDATVPGGSGNLAGALYSYAAGHNARATNSATFVWSDSSSLSSFTSTAQNQFLIRAAGGVGIGTNAPATALHVVGVIQTDGLKLTTGPSSGAVLASDATGNASWQTAPVRLQTNTTSPDVIGGAASNTIAASVFGSVISGGGNNTGGSNYIAANYGYIGGGTTNRVLGVSGTIAGGNGNTINNSFGTIAGGVANTTGDSATIAGGALNTALGQYSFVGGGQANSAIGAKSVIGGGDNNVANSGFPNVTIGGGESNNASGFFATIAGGLLNTNNGYAAAIGGGQGNKITATGATIPGGSGNLAAGLNSFAAGQSARAANSGAFVWADSSTTAAFSSTAPNQFLIRAAGGVGIGTTNPSQSLSVAGGISLDVNSQNTGSTASALTFGPPGTGEGIGSNRQGGANQYGLDFYTVSQPRLSIANNGNVGIGTTAPGQLLSVAGTISLDSASLNNGSVTANALIFGGSSGEGIASTRQTGSNQFGLDFYTDFTARLSIAQNGFVGLGNSAPASILDIVTTDPIINFRNSNDGGLGGFMQNTYGAVYFGMFNLGANTAGQVATAEKRCFFGFDKSGNVGSLQNDATSGASFRNLLDDGNGNASVSGNLNENGSLVFPSTPTLIGNFYYYHPTYRQMIDFGYDTSTFNPTPSHYAIGVQSATEYFRSAGGFAWYKGGIHNDNQNNNGGGTTLMTLDSNGNLRTISGTLASLSDRNCKTNFTQVDSRAVLNRVLELPISTWSYQNAPADQRHLGPMAQDFYASFHVGLDDKSICTVDAEGVALAAIQGLHQVVREQDDRIQVLEARLNQRNSEFDELRKTVADLKSLILKVAVERLQAAQTTKP